MPDALLEAEGMESADRGDRDNWNPLGDIRLLDLQEISSTSISHTAFIRSNSVTKIDTFNLQCYLLKNHLYLRLI